MKHEDTVSAGINIEDPVGKVVGKRRRPIKTLDPKQGSKKAARAWRKAFPTPFVPKGVYRFRSHEEADAWMWKMIARPPKS